MSDCSTTRPLDPGTPAEPPTRARRSLPARLPLHEIGVWLALGVLLLVGLALSDDFLTPRNLFNIVRQTAPIAIIAVGMTFVIISGGIDLSVGSIVALVGVAVAGALKAEMGLLAALTIGLCLGALAGLLQGLGIVLFRIPPFVMTLAGMTIFRGLAQIYSDGKPITVPAQYGDALERIAWHDVFGVVPIPAVYVLAVFVVGYIVLRHTPLGIYVFAIGGNEEAARLSGVRAGRVKLAVYVICGVCAGLAGCLLTSRVGVGNPNEGQMFELDAIAAVVVGGTALTGGRGGLWGTLAGALILYVLLNLFNILDVAFFYQQVFKGLIIIGAVLLQYKRRS